MKTQAQLVKVASKHIKEMLKDGIVVKSVEIFGQEHAVHKDYVLKAPIPYESEKDYLEDEPKKVCSRCSNPSPDGKYQKDMCSLCFKEHYKTEESDATTFASTIIAGMIKKPEKMEIVMVAYRALPCQLQTFTINGVQADQSQFGNFCSESDGDYGCNNAHFEPTPATTDVLVEYNITEEQYREICERLVDALNIGGCGWCS